MEDKRPEPRDLSHHLSRLTRARQPSKVKEFYKYFQIPGIGQLAGGLPNPSYFPFDTLEAKVARPDRFRPTENRPVDPPATTAALANLCLGRPASSAPPQDAITVPHASGQADPLRKIDLTTALQYGRAEGLPPLYTFLRAFAQNGLHPNCPYRGGPEVIPSCGNTDGFAKVLLAMTNEWSPEKDWTRDREGLLCEEHAYMGAIQTARPRGLNVVPVKMDDEGLKVEGAGGMRDVLANWDATKGKRPHLLYTVTIGQNPTGGVLSVQRRKDILAVCNEYDVIIVEDDPYWYLQFPSATSQNSTTVADSSNTSFNPSCAMFANAEPHPAGWKSSGYPFLDSLVPSFINFDTEGRVIRLDTFSKTVAPGCRLGWITTQPAIIERLARITETTTQQPSGFVQSLIAELLVGPGSPSSLSTTSKSSIPQSEGWQFAGWVRWLEGLRGNYERRMNTMCRILEAGTHIVKSGRRPSLSSSLAPGRSASPSYSSDEEEWAVVQKTQIYAFDWPLGGMFVWLRVLFHTHPLWHSYSSEPERLARALWLFWTTPKYRVLNAPGTMFSPTDDVRAKEGWKFFRLCFAAIEEDALEDVSRRLVKGIQAFWRIRDKKDMEKLLEEDQSAEGVSMVEGMGLMVGPC